jgi:hypothetical protein
MPVRVSTIEDRARPLKEKVEDLLRRDPMEAYSVAEILRGLKLSPPSATKLATNLGELLAGLAIDIGLSRLTADVQTEIEKSVISALLELVWAGRVECRQHDGAVRFWYARQQRFG